MAADRQTRVWLKRVGVLDPFRFVLMCLAGWISQQQQQAIEYLREENRVLREQLGCRRLRFTDDQRRLLAAKAKGLGRRALAAIATIVTPEVSMAAKNGAILAGRKVPPVWLRSGLRRHHPWSCIPGFWLPCGQLVVALRQPRFSWRDGGCPNDL
jgi:hypothetical protein